MCRISGCAVRLWYISVVWVVLSGGYAVADEDIWRGVDLSYVNELEDCGAVYRMKGKVRDPYDIFREAGANIVRYRLWHTPKWTSYSTLSDVSKSISRAKSHGFRVLLDFHYSDDWVHPGKQIIPEAWRGLKSTDEVAEALFDYTLSTLKYLHSRELTPDVVQIGNETNTEILLPDEKSGEKPINWERNVKLINAGLLAVKVFGEQTGKVVETMIHIAQPENVEPWLDQAHASGIFHYDIIGISYYSNWSKIALEHIEFMVGQFRKKYGKDVVIVETAYPWTLKEKDGAGNLAGRSALVRGYPATRRGQRRYNIDLMQSILDGGGLGMVYWEPAWISTSCSTRWGKGSHAENQALFDYRKSELHKGADFLSYEYSMTDTSSENHKGGSR